MTRCEFRMEPVPWRGVAALAVGALLLALLPPRRAAAQLSTVQSVAGVLVDSGTDAPIAEGAVTLLRADGRAVRTVITDASGRFRLNAPGPGEYRLRGERIGYLTSQSQTFRLDPGDALSLHFALSTRAVVLEPLRVQAGRLNTTAYRPAGLDPFYDRLEWWSRLGGVYLTKERVREWDGGLVTSMIAHTANGKPDGHGNVLLRQGCRPTLFLNGAKLTMLGGDTLDDLFRPSDLEAVEVYRGPGELPAEFGGAQGRCAIVLWTRRTY